MHRPSNVDDKDQLIKLFDCLQQLDKSFVFPIHPRTQKNIQNFEIKVPNNITVIEPLGYLDMMGLVYHSDFVFTDSGGLQKEAFFLNKKCVTLRDTTEWIETIDCNANMLAIDSHGEIKINEIMTFLTDSLAINEKNRPYGDGKSAEKISQILESLF